MNAHYDPDRTTAENFDHDDLEMVQEYLDHPNTVALYDDLGREFQRRPPFEQIPELEEFLHKTRALLRELPDDGKHLKELRLALATQVVAAEERIAYLRNESPSQP